MTESLDKSLLELEVELLDMAEGGRMPLLAELRVEAETLGVPESELTSFVLTQQNLYRDERAGERAERERERAGREREREEKERERTEKERVREHEVRLLELRREPPEPQLNITPPKLPIYRDGEDITAFLIRFERIAELIRLDVNLYAVHLGSLLSGKALAIYSSLSPETTANYVSLKKSLLAGFNKNPDSYREEFRRHRIGSSETYEQFAVQLNRLLNFWLDSRDITRDFESLKQFIIVDQFTSACNPMLRTYLK